MRTGLLSAFPFLAMAAVGAADMMGGPGIGLQPMMALGPAFAGLTGGKRRTALVGALAMALSIALSLYNDQFGERRGNATLISVAGVSVAALVATAMRQRREAELANVRSIAEAAQRVLLRPVPRGAGRLRVAVSYTSAVADARIGGDLYEVVTSPHGVRVIIGDVQGKGLEAVETAAVVLGAFREAAYDEPDLPAVGERLERALDRHLLGEKFVTAVLVEVPHGQGTRSATLLNFGHPAPLAIRHDGSVHFANRRAAACRSAWACTAATRPARTRCPSHPATSCCSTPTGSPRPATATITSTRWTSAPICSRTPIRKAPWRPCTRTSRSTSAAPSTTTRRCCCCATATTPYRGGPPPRSDHRPPGHGQQGAVRTPSAGNPRAGAGPCRN